MGSKWQALMMERQDREAEDAEKRALLMQAGTQGIPALTRAYSGHQRALAEGYLDIDVPGVEGASMYESSGKKDWWNPFTSGDKMVDLTKEGKAYLETLPEGYHDLGLRKQDVKSTALARNIQKYKDAEAGAPAKPDMIMPDSEEMDWPEDVVTTTDEFGVQTTHSTIEGPDIEFPEFREYKTRPRDPRQSSIYQGAERLTEQMDKSEQIDWADVEFEIPPDVEFDPFPEWKEPPPRPLSTADLQALESQKPIISSSSTSFEKALSGPDLSGLNISEQLHFQKGQTINPVQKSSKSVLTPPAKKADWLKSVDFQGPSDIQKALTEISQTKNPYGLGTSSDVSSKIPSKAPKLFDPIPGDVPKFGTQTFDDYIKDIQSSAIDIGKSSTAFKPDLAGAFPSNIPKQPSSTLPKFGFTPESIGPKFGKGTSIVGGGKKAVEGLTEKVSGMSKFEKAAGAAGTLYSAYNLAKNWDEMDDAERALGIGSTGLGAAAMFIPGAQPFAAALGGVQFLMGLNKPKKKKRGFRGWR